MMRSFSPLLALMLAQTIDLGAVDWSALGEVGILAVAVMVGGVSIYILARTLSPAIKAMASTASLINETNQALLRSNEQALKQQEQTNRIIDGHRKAVEVQTSTLSALVAHISAMQKDTATSAEKIIEAAGAAAAASGATAAEFGRHETVMAAAMLSLAGKMDQVIGEVQTLRASDKRLDHISDQLREIREAMRGGERSDDLPLPTPVMMVIESIQVEAI